MEPITGMHLFLSAFKVVSDTIRLGNAIVWGRAGGKRAASVLVRHTSGDAADASDRMICETDRGKLHLDRDGTGRAAKVHFHAQPHCP